VLPDVDILWQDSADDEGISNLVPISAPREDSCAGITCANVATASICKSLPDWAEIKKLGMFLQESNVSRRGVNDWIDQIFDALK